MELATPVQSIIAPSYDLTNIETPQVSCIVMFISLDLDDFIVSSMTLPHNDEPLT